MWCRQCGIETNEKRCPVCGSVTEEVVPAETAWCSSCHIPVIRTQSQKEWETCPLCGEKLQSLSTDLRPVFPEERLLMEILLGEAPNSLKDVSVWACNNRYYIDGKPHAVPNSLYLETDADDVREKLSRNQEGNSYGGFDRYRRRFVEANRPRLESLREEAYSFIRKTAVKVPEERIVISFSGGKDSTVTADLVPRALSNPWLVHIFGNTTLEIPTTMDYMERYRQSHPDAIFQIAKNDEQDFYEVCKDIGPPARMIRWCCTMFKTGPISRIISGMYGNAQILTYYGIRKAESVSRSKYNRVEDSTDAVKINQQTVASPIFHWKDIDIWLYILAEDLDFNEAYRFGWDRIGCWCCPNNNQRAQFLCRVYMPEQSKRWRDFLVDFARKIGKPDPEVYVDSEGWKARQGGNGLAAAGDVKLRYTNCTSEEHAKIYRLKRPFDDSFTGLFWPIGRVAPELGRKLLHEVLVLDRNTGVPILSLQPFTQDGYAHAVKVRTMNVADHDALQRMASYQIRKFNACRKCLKCEALCRFGAISIRGGSYTIDPDKCVSCKTCVTAKYLDGGCLMDNYLRTK